jgi:hypothetical protein
MPTVQATDLCKLTENDAEYNAALKVVQLAQHYAEPSGQDLWHMSLQLVNGNIAKQVKATQSTSQLASKQSRQHCFHL